MRIGLHQCSAAGLSPAERLDDLAQTIDGARLDLVICPELFLSGYNCGDALRDLAQAADGPFARNAGALARRTGTAIVYGFPERAGDTLYNSAICIGPDANPIAVHRKTVLPPGFEPEYFEAGSAPPPDPSSRRG